MSRRVCQLLFLVAVVGLAGGERPGLSGVPAHAKKGAGGPNAADGVRAQEEHLPILLSLGTESVSRGSLSVALRRHDSSARVGGHAAASAGEPDEECPWLVPHPGEDSLVLCEDNTLVADWRCWTSGHGQRKQCPKDYPLMCADLSCGGEKDHCCRNDCADRGGNRICHKAAVDVPQLTPDDEDAAVAGSAGKDGSTVHHNTDHHVQHHAGGGATPHTAKAHGSTAGGGTPSHEESHKEEKSVALPAGKEVAQPPSSETIVGEVTDVVKNIFGGSEEADKTPPSAPDDEKCGELEDLRVPFHAASKDCLSPILKAKETKGVSLPKDAEAQGKKVATSLIWSSEPELAVPNVNLLMVQAEHRDVDAMQWKAEEELRNLDRNNDLHVDRGEIIRGLLHHLKQHMEVNLRPVFDAADGDGDGVLDVKELGALLSSAGVPKDASPGQGVTHALKELMPSEKEELATGGESSAPPVQKDVGAAIVAKFQEVEACRCSAVSEIFEKLAMMEEDTYAGCSAWAPLMQEVNREVSGLCGPAVAACRKKLMQQLSKFVQGVQDCVSEAGLKGNITQAHGCFCSQEEPVEMHDPEKYTSCQPTYEIVRAYLAVRHAHCKRSDVGSLVARGKQEELVALPSGAWARRKPPRNLDS